MKGQFFPYKDENISNKFPIISMTIIIINIIVFLWSFGDFKTITNTWGFIPAKFTIVTIITSMFLHGGLAHIFGNMWYLWIFGDNVEAKLGRIRFLLFYMVSGIVASLTHFVTNLGSIVPAIGASGAISGILGAYFVLFPHARIKVIAYIEVLSIPAYYVIGFWFFIQLLFGSLSLLGGASSGIAFFAHIGGFIFGAGMMMLWKNLKKKRKSR